MLQSPLRFTHYVLRNHWVSGLLLAGFLALYTFTLSPDFLPADSGEFQAVVPLLGVAHPPGFSLYILLGKLFITLIPFGSPAYRLNLFSAFTSALTLVVVNLAVARLTRSSRLPGLLASFTLGLSTTFWSQATTANIRSLMALLTALLVYAFINYRLTPTLNRLAFFFFTLSLAVVHHLSLAFIAIILLLALPFISPISFAWATPFGRVAPTSLISFISLHPLIPNPHPPNSPPSLISPISLLKLFLAALLPLLILLYLPIRGALGAYLAPPGLDTLPGFLQHALGLGFGGDFFYFAQFSALPDRLVILFNIFEFQFNTVVLIFLALGLLLFFRQDWKPALALTLAFAVHAFIAITYRAPQTVEYLLPAYVILAIVSAAGLQQLTTFANTAIIPSRYRVITHYALRITLYASLFIASLFIAFRNYPAYRALAFDTSTRDYAADALQAAPPNALILSAWHYATPMWYLQQIEGRRLDVTVDYVFPQGTSLAQNWVDRLNTNIPNRPTLVTNFYPQEYAGTPYRFVPLGPLWQAVAGPLTELPSGLSPLNEPHAQDWTVVGANMLANGGEITSGQTLTAVVAWQAPARPTDINFFVQLLGPDGMLYGQMDVSHPAAKIAPNEILVDKYVLTPNVGLPPSPLTSTYRLVTGAYLPDGSRLAPDFTELATLTLLPRPTAPATRHPTTRLLAGYDYDLSLPDSPRLYLHWQLDGKPHEIILGDDHGGRPLGPPLRRTISLPPSIGYMTTAQDLLLGFQNLTLTENPSQRLISNLQSPISLQSRYVSFGPLILVGSTITRESDGAYRVDLDWLADRPLTGDYIIKVDLIGENYAWRDQSDSVPAGGAIPTLKWIPGIIIRDRHRLKLLQPTPAAFQLAVYDHFTQRNLPILDARLAQLGPTVTLGTVQP